MSREPVIWRPPNWPEIRPKADEALREMDIDVTPKHQGIYLAGVEAGASAILKEGRRIAEGALDALGYKQNGPLIG